jgi:transcriptional regulator with GAF, ATPase, and Fis domain
MYIWAPHWDFRENENLVMCRHGDTGDYAWGNVRIDTQRRNLLERSEICRRRAAVAELACAKSLPQMVIDLQKSSINHALELENWHVTNAARRLGISFRTLRYLMKNLFIEKQKREKPGAKTV